MPSALAVLLALLVALAPEAVVAQTSEPVLITIKSDGSCHAIGVTAPCREIGSKLREAGIPSDTRIRFTGGADLSYGVIKASMDSVAQAGYRNTMIGFITTPAP